jgi:hypothetical protein
MVFKKLSNNDRVSDTAFDSLFPDYHKKISSIHWTPVKIAKEATHWLAIGRDKKILDIGSGVGKFCLIGSVIKHSHFHGVEQRKSLTDITQDIIDKREITNVTVENKNFQEIDFQEYDGFYVFNPFWENIKVSLAIDFEVPLSGYLYHFNHSYLKMKLESAKIGSKLVTYAVQETQIPSCYKAVQRLHCNTLIFWKKIT